MATATLYRMVMPEHICPYGLKSYDLLKRKGYTIDDHHLETREETDAFKQEHHVETTPQVFIDGQRVGGYEALKEELGVADHSERDYTPIVAIFATTFLMALGATWASTDALISMGLLERFVAFSMAVLAILKLRDVEGFSLRFLNYDLLAQQWVPYSVVYPYAEGAVALCMIAGILTVPAAFVALFIGGIGAVSVIKAVYIDGRELKCACVGGQSNVPLGAISLTENVMMVAMGVWMLVKAWSTWG